MAEIVFRKSGIMSGGSLENENLRGEGEIFNFWVLAKGREMRRE